MLNTVAIVIPSTDEPRSCSLSNFRGSLTIMVGSEQIVVDLDETLKAIHFFKKVDDLADSEGI